MPGDLEGGLGVGLIHHGVPGGVTVEGDDITVMDEAEAIFDDGGDALRGDAGFLNIPNHLVLGGAGDF